MVSLAPKLNSQPLATWEREGLAAALHKAGLPADDVKAAGPLFWRFETKGGVPVGFGGLELHGSDAVLRSVVTLPPLRRRGVGAAMVAALEAEAAMLKAATVWLATTDCALFFGRLGYAACQAEDVPEAVRASGPFAAVTGPAATAMVKRL
jgi:N-acetylglutamate synthase-like GNAT family acetyltransferase